jgi:hypothetical protein
MRLTTGKTYLLMERVPLRTHQILRRELAQGRKVLYFSKNSPTLLKTQLDFEPEQIEMRWLNPRPKEECSSPMDLEAFESKATRFMEKNKDGIVVLNGLEVLEMWNGFRPVFDRLQSMHNKVSANGNNLIITFDPKNQITDHVDVLNGMADEVIADKPSQS